MRQGAVLAGGDDRRKRRVVRAELAHPLMGVEHDLAFRPAHHAPVEDPSVDLIGQPGGLADRAKLAGVLAATKALDQAPGRHQLHSFGNELLELAQVLDTGLGVVVADSAVQPLDGAGEQLALRRRLLELRRHLALGALNVTKVGQEDAVLRAHDRQAAGAAEPGQPAQVRDRVGGGVSGANKVTDQQLVDSPLPKEGCESLGAARGAHPSACLSISSASR